MSDRHMSERHRPFYEGETLTAEKLNGAFSRCVLTPDGMEAIVGAPPNWLQRVLWRVCFGVIWLDNRPERRLAELRKLA